MRVDIYLSVVKSVGQESVAADAIAGKACAVSEDSDLSVESVNVENIKSILECGLRVSNDSCISVK